MAHIDNLEFLVDVVPRTVPFKQVREKKAPAAPKAGNGESSAAAGQATLDGMSAFVNGANGAAGHDAEEEEVADPNAQLEMEMRGRPASSSGSQNGWSGSRDVEMS